MDPDTAKLLRNLGDQLDRGIFPRVKNGGVIVPSEPADSPPELGSTEVSNERQRERRPATGSWPRAEGRQGAASRPWATCDASPVIGASLRERYEQELEEVFEAYPGMRSWPDDTGLWLMTKSSVLPGISQEACFVTCIHYPQAIVRSWGFWTFLGGCEWIGPRHTNYPDGSVCAFEPKDGTWIPGDSLVKLLDIYSVWALRHLHLREFGRWPGPQALQYPFERILELREDELCGCSDGTKKYGECCRANDRSRNQVAEAIGFLRRFSWGVREPPAAIVTSVITQQRPPRPEAVL